MTSVYCDTWAENANFTLFETTEGEHLLVPSSRIVDDRRAYGAQDVKLAPGALVLVNVEGESEFSTYVRKVFFKYIVPFVNVQFVFKNKSTKVDADGVLTVQLKTGNQDGLAGLCSCIGCNKAAITLITNAKVGIKMPPSLLVHEVGHMLGMAHEQTHPVAKLTWIPSEIKKVYGAALPPGVDLMAQFKPLEGPLSILPFDTKSVMAYDLSASMNKEHVALTTNQDGYTDMDKLWLYLTYGEPGSGPGPRPKFPNVKDRKTIDTLLQKISKYF